MISVFVADDHEIVRTGLRQLLDAEGDLAVVGEAATIAEALEAVPRLHPDVAIIDVRLGPESGVELCRELRALDPGLACVMLTSFADDEALVASVLAGASGYILKDIRTSDLVVAIRRVAAGESLLDASLVRRVVDRLSVPRQHDQRLASLSPREQRILDLIVEGKTNRQIAGELYLAEKTVKNYVSNLLGKLGLSRRTEAAVYRLRHGETVERP